MNPIKVQKDHYDQQALFTKIEKLSEKIGSQSLWASVRAPYQFVESWLTTQAISGKKFLDYGCGHGIHSIFPAVNGGFVTGVDISRKQIELGKIRASECGVENQTSFQVGNCEELHFSLRR